MERAAECRQADGSKKELSVQTDQISQGMIKPDKTEQILSGNLNTDMA